MVSAAKLHFKRNGVENRHAFHDVGAASAELALQATANGLFIHQMAGFDVPKTREVYSISEGYEPVVAMPKNGGLPLKAHARLSRRSTNFV